MVYDETSKEWRPTWGYNKTKDKDTTNNWLIEVKQNEDPNQDFFAKRTEAKTERVAKNELQRLRNISRGKKKGSTIQSGGLGITPNITDDKVQDKFKVFEFLVFRIIFFKHKCQTQRYKKHVFLNQFLK